MKRQPYEEPAFTSTRTDADTYADRAMDVLALDHLDERERGRIRDALRAAYLDGECQGECQGILILTFAENRRKRVGGKRAIEEAIRVLMDGANY